MKEAKKRARKQEKLIEYLKAQGKLTEEQAEEIKTSGPEETSADKSRQAEAVLAFVERPGAFVVKTCKREECGEAFSTNYRAVGYCSDNCRAKALLKIGIQWNRQKSAEDRWGGVPPLVVPPSALQALKELLSQVEPHQKSHQGSLQEVRPVHLEPSALSAANGQSTSVQTSPQQEPVELDFPEIPDLDDLSLP